MKKILFFLIAFCACVTIQAQKVDVVVKLLTSPNRLGIYATATAFGPTAFGPNNLSGLTPTIKWSTGCGDVSLGTFTNTTSLVLAKQTTGTNGGFNYATIDGNALSAVVLVNGEETLLGTIPIVVVGAASPCDFLASVIHNHPNANDGNFFAESLGTFDITGPSTYTSLAINVVLPVDLVTFKGIKKGKVSQLQWEATGEKNLVNYIVERSTDGRNFHAVGFTKPKSFNATEKVAYDFVDDQPEMGINYYRLLSKGYGKDEKYSKVISLDFGLGLSGRVYPNPLDGELSIDLDIESNAGIVDVSIFDVVGKQILSKKIESSDRRINMTLPTAELPPGIYIVKVKVGTFNWERQITKM